jgi:multiple sugar transport system permease protein
MLFGLGFALVLNEGLRLRGFLRVAVLIPWAVPIAVSARVWELIYNYDYGLFNFVGLRLGFFSAPINWLGSSKGAFLALVLADVWKTTPFVAIILLAGLSGIPRDLYKQAAVDGATTLQRFCRITVPLLKPVILVALLFRTIDAVRVFDVVYVLTRGGPGGDTTPLSLYAFKYFLTGDFGFGSAVSILVFLIAAAFSVLYIRSGKFTRTIAS